MYVCTKSDRAQKQDGTLKKSFPVSVILAAACCFRRLAAHPSVYQRKRRNHCDIITDSLAQKSPN